MTLFRLTKYLDVRNGGVERTAPVSKTCIPVDEPRLVETTERLGNGAWCMQVRGGGGRGGFHYVRRLEKYFHRNDAPDKVLTV